MTDRISNLSFNSLEEFQLDLFHTLKISNVSLVLYNRMMELMKWHQSTILVYGTRNRMNRETLISDFNHKLYGKQVIMKPRVHNVDLFSSRVTNIVTFSIKDMILCMVNNKGLFHPDNLLLDPDNS